jgi:hypothetical protein
MLKDVRLVLKRGYSWCVLWSLALPSLTRFPAWRQIGEHSHSTAFAPDQVEDLHYATDQPSRLR